nr:hypothetical protein [Tanacetum cinerariifolium]
MESVSRIWNVIDAYIPNRRSKTGWKGVSSKCGEDGLFRGTSKYYGGNNHHSLYVFAVKQGSKQQGVEEMNKPSLVLDDSCILHQDFSSSLMGKVKDFGSLLNSKLFLAKEELASNSFIIDERVTWIDIEGVPLKVWTNNTFAKISSKWGEFLYDEDKDELCFNSKVYWVRTKEVSGWVPDFMEDEIEEEDDSDNDSMEEDLQEENGEHSDGNLKYPPGFTPMDATKVNSNSVDKDSREEKECDQNCYENEEVLVTKKN